MYEVADGHRIQMWQASTTTDSLPASDIASELVNYNLERKISFSLKQRMQSNLLSVIGPGVIISFVVSYLIITVVPGDLSLWC